MDSRRTPSPSTQPAALDVAGKATPLVTPLLVRQLVLEVSRQGVDASTLCRGLGFGVSDLFEPDFLVSYAQTREVLRRALPLLAQPHPGLQLGASFNVVSWGVCLLALMSAADSHQMLERAALNLPSLGPFMRLNLHDGPMHLSVFADDADGDSEISSFLVEHTFASVSRVACFVVAPSFRPIGVDFTLARPPGALAPFRQVFDCPVRFQQPANRLVYPSRPEPIATADEVVSTLCDRLLTDRRTSVGERSQVEQVIVRAIRGKLQSPPTMRLIADSIHLSERTLRRRLDAAGLAYAGLLDDERRRAVLALMRDDTLPLARVAQACGFADVRSLRRALKRWTGLTPSEVRRVPA